MDVVSGSKVRLTNSATRKYVLDWSPDGRQILFEISPLEKSSGLHVINIESRNIGKLSDLMPSGDVPYEAWTPDGKSIIFAVESNENIEIFASYSDGSNLCNLTRNAADDGLPSMSPNGKQIAFSSDRDGNSEIYTLNVDGSNINRLTNSAQSENILPIWSPDSEQDRFSFCSEKQR